MNPVTLSEALPFLVIIVGFEKQFVLARAVFKNPAIYGNEPLATSRPDLGFFQSLDQSLRTRNSNPELMESSFSSQGNAFTNGRYREPKAAKDIVVQAVNKYGGQIIKDYAIEIAVLAVGAISGISGLMEFCQLGALILAFDCIFLFVFYVSILTIMVEVCRIRMSLHDFDISHRYAE